MTTIFLLNGEVINQYDGELHISTNDYIRFNNDVSNIYMVWRKQYDISNDNPMLAVELLRVSSD